MTMPQLKVLILLLRLHSARELSGFRRWGLLKLGVPKWIADRGPGWGDYQQPVNQKLVLRPAISKPVLTKRRLVSCLDYYLERQALKAILFKNLFKLGQPCRRSIEAGQKLNLRRKSSKSFHDKTRLGGESSFKYKKRTKKFYALQRILFCSLFCLIYPF